MVATEVAVEAAEKVAKEEAGAAKGGAEAPAAVIEETRAPSAWEMISAVGAAWLATQPLEYCATVSQRALRTGQCTASRHR